MSIESNHSASLEEHRAIWEQYVACWKIEGRAAKKAQLPACLAPGCRYTDPLTVAEGFDALADYMVDFHRQIPGGHFVTTTFEAHNRRSLARWEMRGAGGEVLGVGASYGEYNSDGKLRAMTGFFQVPGV